MVISELTSRIGNTSTKTVTSSVSSWFPSDTVTEYVVVSNGFTSIVGVVSPLFHKKFVPPDAESVTESPTQMVWSSPASAFRGTGITVIIEVPVKPPSFDINLISTIPSELPVTVPLELTVAIDSFSDVQIPDWSVVFAGVNWVFKSIVCDKFIVATFGVIVTPVASTFPATPTSTIFKYSSNQV